MNIRLQAKYYPLVVFRQTIASVVSLALLHASSWGLACVINCNHLALANRATKLSPEVVVQQHSHHHGGVTAKFACCPTGAQVLNSSCVPDVQSGSAVEVRSRVNFDSVASGLTRIVSALATHSETALLASSPPASSLRAVAPNLRI